MTSRPGSTTPRTTPYDPRFREALARIRKEMPEEWTALVQKLTVPAKA
ncbi:hypothetical protein [Methanoculleus sp.]|nr:hypothetical protein [Methanoculleus sp.]